MALFRVNQARKDLNNWLQQDPGRGSNNYSAALQNALSNAANRQTPAQRYNTGSDQNIQASRENYRLMAQRAADAAAAGTQDLSGGYDASYANSAAEQGRQILMEGQHDNEQALRQLALEGLAAESSQADVLTQALLGAQQLEISANQLAQDRYQAQRDFLTGEVQQAQAEKDNVLGNLWDALVWAGQTALRTYDNYKGYSQQQFENAFSMMQYMDALEQQALENERYNTEYSDSRADVAWEQALAEQQYTDSRADTAWEQGITERQLALDELAYQDDHAYKQAQIANMGRSRSSSGGGSSGGLDYGDAIGLLEGYSKAYWADDPTLAVYDVLLGTMGLSPGGFGGTSTGAAPIGSVYDAADRARKEYNLTMDGTYRYLLDAGYDQDDIDRAMYEMQSLWG